MKYKEKSVLTASPHGQEIKIERTFDASVEKLFEAYTNPQLIPHWWGPRAYTTRVDKMEPKTGGTWRFIQRDSSGNKYAFHGVYHCVTPLKSIVSTFEWEGMPNHVLLDTVTFQSIGNKTKITINSVFQTTTDRDIMLNSGMKEGAFETWERLAFLVENK